MYNSQCKICAHMFQNTEKVTKWTENMRHNKKLTIIMSVKETRDIGLIKAIQSKGRTESLNKRR